jgi:hypothetical protein
MSDLSPAPVASVSSQIVQLLTDALEKKPQTKAEALELYHRLSVQLGTWLVSDLPALEQKSVLVSLWAEKAIEAKLMGCFGKK